MGVAVVLANVFDPFEREVIKLERPTSVRHLVRKRLRRHTVVCRTKRDPVRRLRFRQPTVVRLNGKVILQRQWRSIVVGEKDIVTFQAMPAGGAGGGGGGSNPLGAVLMVAVVVATAVLAPELAPFLVEAGIGATTATALATAGIGLALSAVAYGIMSLFVAAPPAPTAQDTGAIMGNVPQASPTYNLQAQGNTARLGQPIPELFGRTQIFPDFANQPYQSFESNDQYLHYLMVVTKGSVDLADADVRIGDTPAANFPEITWQKVEPGGTIPTTLVDPMMITSTELAQAELVGSEGGSPIKGPYIVNPATTIIQTVEIDYAAPNGLYYVNDDSSLAARGFTFKLEIQKIDDDGNALDAWTLLDTVSESAADRTPRRWTRHYDLGRTGRFQVRAYRTDAKDTSTRAADEVDWIGLRGSQPGTRTYPGVTLLAMKLKATGNLTSTSSKQVNLIPTRKLPTYDPVTGTMGATLSATRNPCDAFAYICLAQNGGRLTESQVALAELYAGKADFDAKGWTFDGVFDTSVTAFEAVSRIGRGVIAQPIVQGMKVRLVRDLPSSGPGVVFTPRNITKNSLKIAYKFPDPSKTADAVQIQYIDPRNWKPAFVTCALAGSSADNPATIQLFGCTNRQQARAYGFYMARSNVYRRRAVPFGTEMEGLMLMYGEPIEISHDMPSWGQSAEAIGFDEETRTLLVDQPLTFTTGPHFVALRKRDGTRAGPYVATAVTDDPYRIVLGDGDLPELELDGDAERTFVQFGPSDNYSKPLKVISVTPRSETTADVVALDDDPRMYDPIPDEEDAAPIPPDVTDVVVHVSSSTGNINLRTLANHGGYVEDDGQTVTIQVDAGVEVVSVVRGDFPAGFQPLLIVQGTLSGTNGAPGSAGGDSGGAGSGGPGGAGGAGGPALDARSGPLKLRYTGGTIRGGRGGGGGGGGGGGAFYTLGDVGQIVGGGSGGQGNGGGGHDGGNDGHAQGGRGGDGGAQGAYAGGGANGSDGAGGNVYDSSNPAIGSITTYGGGPGGPGGAPGPAILGIANVTVDGTPGTLIGATA